LLGERVDLESGAIIGETPFHGNLVFPSHCIGKNGFAALAGMDDMAGSH
jgi:hypothetical protein